MFTGIIQGLGEIIALNPLGKDLRVHIKALYALDNIQVGESIAVNGTCLTVESHGSRTFTAFASAETLSRTSLGALSTTSLVNLERALALGDRLGGHIVSGHVDALGTVENITSIAGSHCVRVSFPSAHQQEVIPKGSVTLDGISLTVNDCGSTFLEVNAIPETWNSTTMRLWQIGRRINVETDVIGKYVCNMLAPWRHNSAATQQSPASTLTESFLKEHGF